MNDPAVRRDALDEPITMRTSDAAAARRQEAYRPESGKPCPVPRCDHILELDGLGRYAPALVCPQHGQVAEDRGAWLWASLDARLAAEREAEPAPGPTTPPPASARGHRRPQRPAEVA